MWRALLTSPARNLLFALGFVAMVSLAAAGAYAGAGWGLSDSLYMVVLTVFTVGYGEVRPVDSTYLRVVTIALMVLGCGGMIVASSALVQFLTSLQIQQLLGQRRMSAEIDRLQGHVIICGFGRLGQILCRELRAGQAPFVVVERSAEKFEAARAKGFLALHADAEAEETLTLAGVARARALATVVPNDAANVYITLSARSLNRGLLIVARGESPSTETKLRQAGANEVVLPAHIGAERMAELVLYAGATRAALSSPQMRSAESGLRRLGLEMELVVAGPRDFAGRSVADVEAASGHAFLVVSIQRQDGPDDERPGPGSRIAAGDGVVIVGRGGRARMLEAFGA